MGNRNKIAKYNCPSCGAVLKIKGRAASIRCPWCETSTSVAVLKRESERAQRAAGEDDEAAEDLILRGKAALPASMPGSEGTEADRASEPGRGPAYPEEAGHRPASGRNMRESADREHSGAERPGRRPRNQERENSGRRSKVPVVLGILLIILLIVLIVVYGWDAKIRADRAREIAAAEAAEEEAAEEAREKLHTVLTGTWIGMQGDGIALSADGTAERFDRNEQAVLPGGTWRVDDDERIVVSGLLSGGDLQASLRDTDGGLLFEGPDAGAWTPERFVRVSGETSERDAEGWITLVEQELGIAIERKREPFDVTVGGIRFTFPSYYLKAQLSDTLDAYITADGTAVILTGAIEMALGEQEALVLRAAVAGDDRLGEEELATINESLMGTFGGVSFLSGEDVERQSDPSTVAGFWAVHTTEHVVADESSEEASGEGETEDAEETDESSKDWVTDAEDYYIINTDSNRCVMVYQLTGAQTDELYKADFAEMTANAVAIPVPSAPEENTGDGGAAAAEAAPSAAAEQIDAELRAFLSEFAVFVDGYVDFTKQYLSDPAGIENADETYRAKEAALESYEARLGAYDVNAMSAADAAFYYEVVAACRARLAELSQ